MSVHNSGIRKKQETGKKTDAERRESQEAERMGQRDQRRKGPEGELLLVIRCTAGLENMPEEGRRGRQRGLHRGPS